MNLWIILQTAPHMSRRKLHPALSCGTRQKSCLDWKQPRAPFIIQRFQGPVEFHSLGTGSHLSIPGIRCGTAQQVHQHSLSGKWWQNLLFFFFYLGTNVQFWENCGVFGTFVITIRWFVYRYERLLLRDLGRSFSECCHCNSVFHRLTVITKADRT